MQSYNDEALVLRRRPWAEQDILLTLFSRDHGKSTVLAKGVRSIRSVRGGHIDLFNVVQVQVRKGKGFGLLTEARVREDFSKIKDSWGLLRFFYYIDELINTLFYDDEAHPLIYTKTVALLMNLQNASEEQSLNRFVRDYEIFLLRELGYWSDDEYRPLYPRVLMQQRKFNQTLLQEVAGRPFKTLSLQ